VSAHYDDIDSERRGIVRSMQLMSDEAQALTREIREQSASHLQAILDNVKDAIVTVDGGGHIESFNPTGERIFGYAPAEILGRGLDYLLPETNARGAVEFLERCAAKIDDTHVDLAAHQTWGTTKDGARVALEVAVSKASLNRRDAYVDARERGAVPHAGRARSRGDPGIRRRSRPVRRRE
jgi:PAS domain S-box-containing protein